MDMENQVADNEMAMEALRWFVSDIYQNKLEADRECEEAISEEKDFTTLTKRNGIPFLTST